jgi:hypothetical protein
MANYDSKYLKYKNKYINLKNEYYGGGNIDIIILYDDTNIEVNNLFNTIKEGYINHYSSKDNIKQKYYIDDSINLREQLNCILNVYTYILGDNKIESEFRFNFNNLKNVSKNGSRRMQPLLIPFKKAINQYNKASRIELKNDYVDYIITNYNCDSLTLQLNKLMDHINTNDNLNNASRITSTKALLELVKLYQNKGEVEDVKYQSTRIGQFVTLTKNDNIIIPAGVTADIQIIGEEKEEQKENTEEQTEKGKKKDVQKEIRSNKEKEREKEIKLKEYLREGRTELMLNLNISNFKFNNLNNMIQVRISKDKVKMKRKNPLIEVINIFNK